METPRNFDDVTPKVSPDGRP